MIHMQCMDEKVTTKLAKFRHIPATGVLQRGNDG